MAPLKMNARWVDSLTPPPVGTAHYRDSVARGLELRVSSRGRKTWVWRYSTRRDGKRIYPEVILGYYDAVSLADAREQISLGQRALQKGEDPMTALALTRPAPPSVRPAPVVRQGVDIPPAVRALIGVGPDAVIEADSFGALAAHYLVHYAMAPDAKGRPRLAKWKADARMLRSYLVPTWRDLPVKTIDRRLIHAVCDRIAEVGSESPWVLALRAKGKGPKPKPAPSQANAVGSLVSRVMSHAVDRSWITVHPSLRLGKRPERTGTRKLDRHEVIELWQACEDDEDPICAAAALLLLFTGQRVSCVLQAEWAEFDLDPVDPWWTVPEDREGNKKKLAHRVPLGAFSVQLLDELRSAQYHARVLFPHRGVGGWHQPGFFEQLYDVLGHARAPMPTGVIAAAMRTRGVQLPAVRAEFARQVGCELSRRSKQPDAYVRRDPDGWVLTGTPLRTVFGNGPLTLHTTSWKQFNARVCRRMHCRPHDLRRTLTTHMGKLKVPHEYKQQILGHTPQDVTSKVYDEYEYDDEKRVAMTLWHRQLRAWKEGGAPEVLRFPVLSLGA